MHRSSVRCSVAQLGTAKPRRVQHSSEGGSIALRMQRSSIGCSIVKKDAMGGARGGEYYISKSLWSSTVYKIKSPGYF